MNNNMKTIVADITTLKVDAIVNAANERLLGGGGIDGAIHRAAGTELKEYCRRFNGCKTGEARITPGFRLPAKYIIHAVGPEYYNSKHREDELKSCYKNSMMLAYENDIHTIVFPSISTGIFHYPKEKAIPIAVSTVNSMIKYLKKEKGYDINVIFCLHDQKTKEMYDKWINNTLSEAAKNGKANEPDNASISHPQKGTDDD